MTLSTDAKRVHDIATAYDKKLLATDPRFCRAVHVVHEDGSIFHLRDAFLVRWQDPAVKPGDWLVASPERKAEILADPTYSDHECDGLWILCFSEHHGFFTWPHADLTDFAQFDVRVTAEDLVLDPL